jgi:excisionase family DNA binding protein
MFVGTKAVAMYLDTSEQNVRSLIMSGRLPAMRFKRNGNYRISVFALRKYIEAQEKIQAEKVSLLRAKRRRRR